MKSSIWTAVAALAVLTCCTDDTTTTEPTGSFANGVFISNEGAFQGGNGTLSFYNPSENKVENDVFASVNARPLGNIAHSVSVGTNLAYIVVHNSNVVEVADANTLESKGTISGLSLPRYAVEISSNEVAISNWGTNSVDFFNPNTQTLISRVTVSNGPERMLIHNGMLYVANSGGFGLDSTVSVIDLTSHSVVDTLFTGYNPNSFAVDAYDNIWILCGGYTDWGNTANNLGASLVEYNTIISSIETVLNFDEADRPNFLAASNSGLTLFYTNNSYGGLPFAFSVSDAALPTQPLINGVALYSLGYDATNNDLYFGDAADYASNGFVYRYSLTTEAISDTLNVGIIPGNFAFNF